MRLLKNDSGRLYVAGSGRRADLVRLEVRQPKFEKIKRLMRYSKTARDLGLVERQSAARQALTCLFYCERFGTTACRGSSNCWADDVQAFPSFTVRLGCAYGRPLQ